MTPIISPPIRRTCFGCGAKLVLAITDEWPETFLVEKPECPGCGRAVRPLTPSERERVEASK